MKLSTEAISFGNRSHSALMTEGLSLHNKIHVAVTLTVVGWSALLLLKKRVKLSDLFYGSGYWLTILFIIYVLSSFWSVWPIFTIYRACELLAFWILAKHLFAQENWQKQIHKLLLAGLSKAWILGLFFQEPKVFTGNNLIAFFRSNEGSLVAAIFIVFLLFKIGRNRTIWTWVELGVAIISLLVFGSFVSFFALIGGLIVLFITNTKTYLRFTIVLIIPSIVIVLMLLSSFIGNDEYAIFGFSYLAKFYDKSPAHLENWTGRIPFWLSVWDIARYKTMGLGFAAAERTVAFGEKFTGTQLINAHSGYISAWLGAGWLGITLLNIFFVAVCSSTRKMPPHFRTLVLSFLAILSINNISFNAFGGQFNVIFMVMMGLACAPIKNKFCTKKPLLRRTV
jgi:hypothetical protein